MEFQKREVKKKVPAGNDIEQKLLNWPDSFYRERDPLVRKSLLDAARLSITVRLPFLQRSLSIKSFVSTSLGTT